MPEQPTEEQIKAFQEKIKNMSPEQLKEFQKQQCIFCKIISGQVASKKIYEDEICLAILDINPANPGHILLMPKEHYSLMPLIPEQELAHLAMVSKALSHVILNKLGADGTNIFVANGTAAGQRSQHFMLHIIPRKENDGVDLSIPENKAKNIAETKKTIIEKIQKVMPDYRAPEKIEKMQEEKIKETDKKEEDLKKEPKKEVPAEKKEKILPAAKKEKIKKKEKQTEVSLDDIASLFK